MSGARSPGPPSQDDPRRLSTALLVAGGVLLIISALLPWVASGSGSTMSLRALGDAVMRGRGGTKVSGWLGSLAYAIPLLGGLVIMAAGLGGRFGRTATIAVATTTTTVAVGAGTWLLMHGRSPGSGFVLGVLGAGSILVATVLTVTGRNVHNSPM